MAGNLEATALIYETNLHYQWWGLIHETDWLVLASSTEWDTSWELSLHLALHAKSILAPKYQVMCARWPYAGRALIPWMKSLRPQRKRRKTLSRADRQCKQRTRGSHYFGKISWDRLTHTVKRGEMTLKIKQTFGLVTFLRWVVPKRFLKSHSPGDWGGLVHVLST